MPAGIPTKTDHVQANAPLEVAQRRRDEIGAEPTDGVAMLQRVPTLRDQA